MSLERASNAEPTAGTPRASRMTSTIEMRKIGRTVLRRSTVAAFEHKRFKPCLAWMGNINAPNVAPSDEAHQTYEVARLLRLPGSLNRPLGSRVRPDQLSQLVRDREPGSHDYQLQLDLLESRDQLDVDGRSGPVRLWTQPCLHGSWRRIRHRHVHAANALDRDRIR